MNYIVKSNAGKARHFKYAKSAVAFYRSLPTYSGKMIGNKNTGAFVRCWA